MKINRLELMKALSMVRPGLASRELIEQSTSFAFLEGSVATYNDEISVTHPVPELKDVSGAVDATELYSLLDRMTHEEVEIITSDKEMLVKSGRARAGLVLQVDLTLPLEDVTSDKEWNDLPEGLINALRFAMLSCSNDMSRPILTCVHINGHHVEGSDNIRLTQYKLEGEVCDVPLLIPSSSIRDLVNYDIVQIAKGVSKGWVHFRTEANTTFSCRLMGADYPNITPILKVEGTEVSIPKELEDVLMRAEVFSKRDIKLDEEVVISLDNKRLSVKARSDSGWFEETVRMKYEGDPVSFSVHPEFLKSMCEVDSTCILSTNPRGRMKFMGDKWVHIISLKGEA